MKVVKEGRPQKGWAKEYKCTGKGNDGGGCGATLLVEEGDLSCTYSHARDETTTYLTFSCCQCGVKTDIWDDETGDNCPISHETYLRVNDRTKEAASDIAKQRSEQRAKLAAAAEPVEGPKPPVVIEELKKLKNIDESEFKEIHMGEGQDVQDACAEVHKRLDEGFHHLATEQLHLFRFQSGMVTKDLFEGNTEIMKVIMDIAVSFGCDVDPTLDDEPGEGRRRIEISRSLAEEDGWGGE